MQRLTASVVVFHADPAQLGATLAALIVAAREATVAVDLFLVDNGGGAALPDGLPPTWCVSTLSGHGNVGFGRGHNLTLGGGGGYHLILNPDLELAPDALREALAFMAGHPECGVVVPSACWEDGRVQYLCKRVPTVLDLFLRGFAPAGVRRCFARRLARYEWRDRVDAARQVVWDPPIASGCCMLFRAPLIKALGGFDPRFFLYFEDFDLSLRAARISRIAYLPSMRVVHHGGHAARKGLRHILMFARSARLFFTLHGWHWW
jgi:GT2 family glycosyltransferase